MMGQIQRRVDQLEKARGNDLPRVVINVLSPCDEHRGPCDHITSATVAGRVFHRKPKESVDEFATRAADSDQSKAVIVMFDGSVNFEPLPPHILVRKERDERH
jgi:hypothetical protein